MAKFNFGNVLGGAVFGGLNAILQHNASRDGYSKANRYEVLIGLPSGTNRVQNKHLVKSAMAGNVISQLHGETARRISFRCDSISMPGRNLRTQMNGNIYAHHMRLYRVKLLQKLKHHSIVVQTLQRSISLKNGKRYHTTQTPMTLITTKNMLVQLRYMHSMKRMKELQVSDL